MGQRNDAIAALKTCVAADPNHPSARHLLVAMGELPAESSPPAGYVSQIFDGYAVNFDKQLTKKLKYSVPGKLFDALAKATGNPQQYGRVVDAGCGTGLSGEPFRGRCEKLIGMDISEGMLEQAAGKQIYDNLLLTDIVAGLDAQTPGTADLVISADTLVYVGSLDGFFGAAARAASGRGQLAFSVESLERAMAQAEEQAPEDEERGGGEAVAFGVQLGEQEGDFVLRESGRYAHGDAYVKRLAAKHGWELLHSEDAVGRYDGPRPVWVTLYAFSRAEATR